MYDYEKDIKSLRPFYLYSVTSEIGRLLIEKIIYMLIARGYNEYEIYLFEDKKKKAEYIRSDSLGVYFVPGHQPREYETEAVTVNGNNYILFLYFATGDEPPFHTNSIQLQFGHTEEVCQIYNYLRKRYKEKDWDKRKRKINHYFK